MASGLSFPILIDLVSPRGEPTSNEFSWVRYVRGLPRRLESRSWQKLGGLFAPARGRRISRQRELLTVGDEKALQRPPSFGHERDSRRRGSPLTYRIPKVSHLTADCDEGAPSIVDA